MLEQNLNSEPKDETLDSSSPNSTNTLVSGLPSLSEMKRFVNADESVKLRVSQILSSLRDVDVLQAKEIVRIVDNYLFRVGQKSQEGVMFAN